MGFTIEDMLVVSADRYDMKLIAGERGWSNSISFLLMLEDDTIIRNFTGKELAVTTGLGFPTEAGLLSLIHLLIDHHASGLLVNTGFYITKIPESAVALCDENDFPLLTVPWDVYLADMIKDLSIRIFLQGSTDEQISEALIRAIENPDATEKARQELLPYFDVDGTFQLYLLYTDGLDRMDTVERKRIMYRLQLYLTNLTHNGHFFYYDACFVLIINALDDKTSRNIIEGCRRRAARHMPEAPIVIGCSSRVSDVSMLSLAYRRAKAALHMALATGKDLLYFDDMGVYRLLCSVDDQALLREMSTGLLGPLIEYDKKHDSNYVETLTLYLKYDESIQSVAKAMFTHRNTVLYRMRNIRRLLGSDLKTGEEKLPYAIACMILKMK